ncbi:MAG: T9SS type A sorting domain-containing protein [Candidatus Krumholzibacteriia bacterium]
MVHVVASFRSPSPLLAAVLLVLLAGQVRAGVDPDRLAAREALRQAALASSHLPPAAILDGAPRRALATAAREDETPAGRAAADLPREGRKSLATLTDEAGMAVPRGGDDIVVDRSAGFDGSAYLQIASDGTYYGALVDNGDVQVYRSTDKGESWTLWSTLDDPAAFIVFLNGFLVAEGDADRAFVAYSDIISADTAQMRVAYVELAAASPAWTVVTALATPGVFHGHNWKFDLATDAAAYPDYFLYLVAESDDGDGTDIWFARSVNQGASFEPGYRIATAGAGSVTDVSNPTIAFGAGDDLHVCYTAERAEGGSTYEDLTHRRAEQWANGGLAAWQTPQTVQTSPAGGSVTCLRTGAALDGGHVFATLLTFDGTFIDNELRFSTDLGATWPAANHATSANLPPGTGMAPVLLPDGGLVLGGTRATFEGGGYIIDLIESRSSLADPTVWSTPQSYSRHPWTGGGVYGRVEAMVPDPAFGNRLAVLWVQTSEPEYVLRFDAEWRRDPGYPNTDVGFPVALSGGGQTPPAVAEIDGDPELEIVFGTYAGDIHVLNHDGTPVPGWPVNIGSMPYDAPVAVGDLSGGGVPTIVAGTRDGVVHAFGPDGTPVPGWPVTLNEAADVFVSIGALGPPYARYVVAVCGHEMRVLRWDGETIDPVWGTFTDAFSRPAAIGDVDGDGTAEVVTLKGSWLHVNSLTQGSPEAFRFFPGEFFSDAPTLADLDDDGTLEIAAPTTAGKLYVLSHDGSDFSAAWPVTLPSSSALTGVAFANILGTAEPELVFAERDNGLVHIRYFNGNEQSSFPKDSGSTVLYMPPMISPVNLSVANVNIGTTDVAGGTARSWRNLGMVPDGWPKNLPGQVEETFAAGDIDLDGRNELVVLGVDFVTVLDVGVAPATAPRNHWPMYGYDAQRTGCLDCDEILTAVGDDEVPAPTAVALTAYPNPFNPATVIEYTVGRAGPVSLAVFDLAGRRVATLVDGEHRDAGRHTVGYTADRSASGVYFVRLQTAGGEATEKIVLLK